MKTPDAINSGFEAVAVVITWLNVRALYRDKKVAGIWTPQMFFFIAWGTWALIMYGGLGFRLSQLFLAVRLAGYVTWVALLLYYRRRPPPTCTGLAAVWCPIHGDCNCDQSDDGSRTLDDPDCPLHAASSTHAAAL